MRGGGLFFLLGSVIAIYGLLVLVGIETKLVYARRRTGETLILNGVVVEGIRMKGSWREVAVGYWERRGTLGIG